MTDCPQNRGNLHVLYEVCSYEKVEFSAPALSRGETLKEKDLLAVGDVAANGKYTIEEHVAHLEAEKRIDPQRPLLVFGLRNNLVNLRAPVIWNDRVWATLGETPTLSSRSYYGIGKNSDRLVIEKALGKAGSVADWPEFYVAGVPVLWDGAVLADPDRLFDLMISEAADQSHIFEIPRGNHPLATDESRAIWAELHRVFIRNTHTSRAEAAQEMRAAVATVVPPLRRVEYYLHSALGIDDKGEIVAVVAHGRLEKLGYYAATHGCRRAIVVENSGSVMPTFLPTGLGGRVIPLIRAPNFRPRGRAVLVFQLRDAEFDCHLFQGC